MTAMGSAASASSAGEVCERQPKTTGEPSVPAFMFQEGNDPIAEQAFREIARLTGGAYCRFDPGAAHQLRELLRVLIEN